MFYKAGEKVITLFDDYTTIRFKGRYKAKHGKRFKTLTPKQMIQKLLKPLAQVTAGKRSGNLLNEICQIIYSLY